MFDPPASDARVDPTVANLVELLRAAVEERGIALAYLFGSREDGTFHARSDIDVGVLTQSRHPMAWSDVSDLSWTLSRRVGTEVDIIDLATADALFRWRVLAHGRLLICRDEDVRRAFVAKTLIDHDDMAWWYPRLLQGTRAEIRRRAEKRGGQVA